MKKYFNNRTLYMSLAFAGYFGTDIYDELIYLKTTVNKWSFVNIAQSLLCITALVIFNIFTRIANRGKLFSKQASALWGWKSLIIMALALLGYIEMRFANGETIYFVTCVFLSSICQALSVVFKDATRLKEEVDLTV